MVLPETIDARVPVQLARLDCERADTQAVSHNPRVLIAHDNIQSVHLSNESLRGHDFCCTGATKMKWE